MTIRCEHGITMPQDLCDILHKCPSSQRSQMNIGIDHLKEAIASFTAVRNYMKNSGNTSYEVFDTYIKQLKDML